MPEPPRSHWQRNLGRVRSILRGKFPKGSTPITDLEKVWMCVILLYECLSLSQSLKFWCHPEQNRTSYHLRRCCVDYYSIGALLVVTAILAAKLTHWFFTFVAVYLAVEILFTSAKGQFVNIYDKDNKPVSPCRSIVLLLLGYATVVLAFAVFYGSAGCITDGRDTILDPIRLAYFSLMTIATVGYGDLHPKYTEGYWLCSLEVAVGIVMVVVLLARFIGLPASAWEDSD